MWYKRRMYPSGIYVNLDKPEQANLYIEDIAWALSMECRFGGSCSRHYSVAEHSLYVVELVPQELKFAALMHDAHEAYVKDMLTGMKDLVPAYRTLERTWSCRLREHFGLQLEDFHAVKYADRQALAAERRDLGIFDLVEWPSLRGIEVPKIPLPYLTQREAFNCFLKAFNTLAPEVQREV